MYNILDPFVEWQRLNANIGNIITALKFKTTQHMNVHWEGNSANPWRVQPGGQEEGKIYQCKYEYNTEDVTSIDSGINDE